jgi:hypothetical protein
MSMAMMRGDMYLRVGHLGTGVATTRRIGFGLAIESVESFMVVEVRSWMARREVG